MKRDISNISSYLQWEGIYTNSSHSPTIAKRKKMTRTSNTSEESAVSHLISHNYKRDGEGQSSCPTKTENVCPHKYLLSILSEQGYSLPKMQSGIQLEGFLEVTDERINAYGKDCIEAVRDNDVPRLREMLNGGRNLQCSNRFGETLVHMACRRGLIEVVTFFLQEANVSLRVMDDYGRTPLHDACWSSSPNFPLVELLLDHDPEQLLVQDVRGHFPLTYTRKNHWEDWRKFLSARSVLLQKNSCLKVEHNQ